MRNKFIVSFHVSRKPGILSVLYGLNGITRPNISRAEARRFIEQLKERGYRSKLTGHIRPSRIFNITLSQLVK